MPVEFGFRMCSFWSNHNITKFLYSAEIPDASILAGIYIILLFFSTLIWCALIFHVYCYGRNVKLLLNYCLSAQEPRIFLPLCIISNAGGFPQYFKIVRPYSGHSGSPAVPDRREHPHCKDLPLLTELSKGSQKLQNPWKSRRAKQNYGRHKVSWPC